MLTQDLIQEIEYCKKTISADIEDILKASDIIKNQLTKEVLISLSYVRIFSAYMNNKKFENIDEAWIFMNDIKGITEKIFYINHYIKRVYDSHKQAQANKK